MKLKTILALAISTTFLAACGGGGGGDTVTGPVVTPLSFPLDAAYTKAMTSGINLNGTAVNGADTYTMSLSITPAADGTFEGLQSKKAVETLTMKKNGVVFAVTNIDAYFSINPLTMKGASYSDGSYAVQTSNTGAYPTSAKVGDSGPQGTLTLYNSFADRTVKSTTQSSWTMEADTATTAYGCSNSILRNAAGAQTGTAAGCYKIDANGNVLGMRYTLSVAGLTLVFK